MLIDFKTLFPKYGINPKGVLHVGASEGQEAQTYADLGIKKVIWIEPIPNIYAKLCENITQFSGHLAFNYCCGDEDYKDMVLHIANNGGQSSSVLELGTHLIEHPDVRYVDNIPVQTRRLDSLFHEGSLPTAELHNYDFLNCDTQGFDLNVVKGLGDLLDNFKWVYIEVNISDVYKNCAQLPEVEEYFSKFRLIKRELRFPPNKTWGDCLFTKND